MRPRAVGPFVERLAFILGLCCLALGWLAPFPHFAAPTQLALGVALCTLIWWTAEPFPVAYVALAILVALPLTGRLDFGASFAAFADKTVWLVFAGMALSLALEESGLGQKLAVLATGRLGKTPFVLLFWLHAIGLLTAVLIPSGMVRTLLLMPLGGALSDAMGGQQDRRLNAAILLSLLCSTILGGFGILTAAVPNLVAAGQYEQTTGQALYWSQWFVWMFPVFGLGRVVVCFGVIWLLFGRGTQLQTKAPKGTKPLDQPQKKTLVLLILGVLMWITDALHQIAPVYVGLILVLVLTLPRLGPLPFAQLRRVDFTVFIYLAGLFALSRYLEAAGVNSLIIQSLTNYIDLGGSSLWSQYLVLALMALPLDFLVDVAAANAMLIPALIDLAQAAGLDPLPTALCVAMSASLLVFPYQSAPLVIAYSFRRFSMGQFIICLGCVALVSALALLPLNILYWLWLGLI